MLSKYTAIWRVNSLTLFLHFFLVYYLCISFFKMSAGPWHFDSVPVDSCFFWSPRKDPIPKKVIYVPEGVLLPLRGWASVIHGTRVLSWTRMSRGGLGCSAAPLSPAGPLAPDDSALIGGSASKSGAGKTVSTHPECGPSSPRPGHVPCFGIILPGRVNSSALLSVVPRPSKGGQGGPGGIGHVASPQWPWGSRGRSGGGHRGQFAQARRRAPPLETKRGVEFSTFVPKW